MTVTPQVSRVALAGSFPRTFWVANVMELFERGAYYGMNSVLAIYLTRAVAQGGLGFGEQAVGFLQSIIYAATYVVPILGGALADRYGYRRVLLVAFSLLATGYFSAGYVSSYGLVFLALLVMATGSGLFKPIITGTIARTTDERTSALGFGVYYWMINFGAFVAPVVVSLVKGFAWKYVFIASAAYTGFMLLPTVFLFEEPPRSASTRTLGDVLKGAAEVLADARYMLMVVIYSGYWVVVFQLYGSVLWYLRDFIDRAPISRAVTSMFAAVGLPWTFVFDVEHVTMIVAGVIILFQVSISRFVNNWPAFRAIVIGISIAAVGYSSLGLFHSPWLFVLAVALTALGDMTAHPKYFSMVGQVAPPDRKALYMGYAFLYGVFGSLIGSSLGGFLYDTMVKRVLGTPLAASRARVFWILFGAIDMLSAVGLILFARSFGTDSPDARRRARPIMDGVYGLVLFVGAVFLVFAVAAATIQYRTAVQAVIFLLLGAGGLVMNRPRLAAASRSQFPRRE
jgi:proton-dependent oligopeptide transporter, POT family